MNDELFALTAVQAARRMGISRTSLYGLIRRGELQTFKVGGARRVRADAVEKFIERAELREAETGDASAERFGRAL